MSHDRQGAGWTTRQYGYEKYTVVDAEGFEKASTHCRDYANIIAAAPDLYRVLDLFVSKFGDKYVDGPYRSRDLDPDLYAIADKALAKARGEA